jgi:hypothetical protein
VGSDARDDEDWVGRIYRALRKHWPNVTERYIDDY